MSKKTIWYVVAGENFGITEDDAGQHLVDNDGKHLAHLDRGLAIGAVAIDVHRTIYTITGVSPYRGLPRLTAMVGSPTKLIE